MNLYYDLGLGYGEEFSLGSPPWTPLETFGSDLIAWYDATDADTMFSDAGTTPITEGGLVYQWNDKSGNGYHLTQATSGNRPTYSATGFQGNKPGITFDGVDNYMDSAPNFGGVSAFSAFIFAQLNAQLLTNAHLLAFRGTGDPSFVENQTSCAFVKMANAETDEIETRRNNTILSKHVDMVLGVYRRFASVFNGTTNVLTLDNAVAGNAAASTAAFSSTGTLRVGSNHIGSSWKGAVKDIILLKRAPTGAEAIAIDSFFQRSWTRIVVTEGDSITFAGPPDISDYLGGFPYRFYPNSNPAAFVCNIAVPGTDFWANLGSLYDRVSSTNAYLPSNKQGRQYVLFFTFANNIGSGFHGGATPPLADYAAAVGAYCASQKSAGWDKVVHATALSRTDSQANDTLRNAYNAIITNGTWAPTYGVDAIVPFAADAIMGVDASPTVNPSYWIDGVHPNAAGQARLEEVFRATINGL